MKPVCKSAKPANSDSARQPRSSAALIASLCLFWTGAGLALPDAALAKPAPPIVVVILPADRKVDDQLAESIVELKDAVRSDARFEVLSFDPDAPSFIIAAKSAGVDLKKLSTDAQRQSLAQALGAKIWVKIGNDRQSDLNVDVAVYNAATGLPVNAGGGSVGTGGLSIQQAVTLVISDATQQPNPPSVIVPAAAPAPAVSVAPVPVVLPSPVAPIAPVAPTFIAPAAPLGTPMPVAPVPQPVMLQPAPVLPPSPPSVPAAAPLTVAPIVSVPPPAVKPLATTAPAVPAPQPKAAAPLITPVPILKQSIPQANNPLARSATPAPVSPPLQNPVPARVPVPSVPPVQVALPQPVAAPPAPPAQLVPLAAPQPVLPPTVSRPVVATPSPPILSASPIPPVQTAPAFQPPVVPPPAAPSAPSEIAPLAGPKPPTPLDGATQALLDQGDAAMARSDDDGAVDDYRNAVDESPRNAAPRVRLAQAYLASGDSAAALNELQRAVAIDPQNRELAAYLQQAQQQHLLPGIDVLVLTVNAASKPGDQQSQLALGDAYWNSKSLVLAEQTYLQAAHAATGESEAEMPYARLARLYAATQRYPECLKAISLSGSLGYPAALRIIQQQSDNLMGSIDSSLQQFSSGAITRTQLYDQLRSLDTQAAAYASFLGKVTPPGEYKISYLHRKLAANLVAQMTPNLLNYALTAQTSYLAQSQSLEHDALAELSQANGIDHLQDAGDNPT